MLHSRLSVVLSLAVVLFSAGCSAPVLDEGSGDLESELAVNEIVQAGTQLRVTAASGLNLREKGGTAAQVIAGLPNGTTVTCASTSGSTGWVNVRTASGQVGWVFGKYVERLDAAADPGATTDAGTGVVDPGTGTPTGGTCAPGRGLNVVSRYQKALHDAIAYAEGTRGRSQDGYDVMFSYRIAPNCIRHPNVCTAFGSTCSTAAGRYQFLNRTWNGAAAARGLTTFEPENQERGAAYLIGTVRRVSIPQDRALTATEFSNAMSALSYEWASLPPGRYGQPTRTLAQLRTTYCSLAGC